MKYKTLRTYFGDRVFSLAEVQNISQENPLYLKSQIHVMAKRHDLDLLKRGKYCLNEAKITPYLLANQLLKPSYLSLETALAFYQLIPDTIINLTSITSRKTQQYTNSRGTFTYRHLPLDKFFGVVEIQEVFWAEPEKALLDYLYLNSGQFAIALDTFTELRLQNITSLDFPKLLDYAHLFSQKKLIRLVELLKDYQE